MTAKTVQTKYWRVGEAEIKDLVREIADRYQPEKIYVYGSFAWGAPDKDSDVDLFIIKDTKDAWQERHAKVRSIIAGRFPVDVLVYTPEQVKERQNMGDLFLRDILNNGELVYERQR